LVVSGVEKVDEEGARNGERGKNSVEKSEWDRNALDKWSGENAMRIEGMVWKREIAS
jgi:hypothetical protein